MVDWDALAGREDLDALGARALPAAEVGLGLRPEKMSSLWRWAAASEEDTAEAV